MTWDVQQLSKGSMEMFCIESRDFKTLPLTVDSLGQTFGRLIQNHNDRCKMSDALQFGPKTQSLH